MTSTSAPDLLSDEWHALLFGVRRSVRYHMARRRFFETWSTFTSASAVILSSATISTVLNEQLQALAVWFAAGVAILQAVDLVVGTARCAWNHADLQKRFIALEQEIVATPETAEALNRFTVARLAIEMDEPPALRALDRMCHNELLRAMGYSAEHFKPVPWYSRLFRQFIDLGMPNAT